MKRLFFTIFSVLIFLSVSAQTTFVKSYDIYKSAFSDLVFAQDDGYLMAMVSLKVDKYYLSFIKTNLNGDISGSLGHLIAETSITSNKTTWDCSSAKEGVYFYRLVSNNKSGSGKIVVGR